MTELRGGSEESDALEDIFLRLTGDKAARGLTEVLDA
jgi:hypothetical protein